MTTTLRHINETTETVDVACGVVYRLFVRFRFTNSDRKSETAFTVEVGDAVKLWRCLMGEYSSETVKTVDTVDPAGRSLSVEIWNHVDPKLGDVWDMALKTGDQTEWLCSLDADQALALAWGIKRCVGGIVSESL